MLGVKVMVFWDVMYCGRLKASAALKFQRSQGLVCCGSADRCLCLEDGKASTRYL